MVEFGPPEAERNAGMQNSGDSGITPQNLKRIEYQGFSESRGEVVYKRSGGVVIFSAIKGSDQATSSINAAEEVVKAICVEEGIDWRLPSFFDDFEFYDFTTPIGYPHRMIEEDYRLMLKGKLEGFEHIEILKLKIIPRPGNRKDIWVDAWQRVSSPIFKASDDISPFFPLLPGDTPESNPTA